MACSRQIIQLIDNWTYGDVDFQWGLYSAHVSSWSCSYSLCSYSEISWRLWTLSEVYTVLMFQVEAVPRARVPIMKFQDRTSKIMVDLSFWNGMPVYNTRLIYQYTQTHPLVRPYLMVIRYWAKVQVSNLETMILLPLFSFQVSKSFQYILWNSIHSFHVWFILVSCRLRTLDIFLQVWSPLFICGSWES